MRRSQKKLGEILIERGRIRPEDLQDALREQAMSKDYIGRILIKRGAITEGDLMQAFSEQFGLKTTELKDHYLDFELMKSFSADLLLLHHCVPIKKDEYGVSFAITNPLDVWAIKKAEGESAGYKANFFLVSESDMQDALKRYKKYIGKGIQAKAG